MRAPDFVSLGVAHNERHRYRLEWWPCYSTDMQRTCCLGSKECANGGELQTWRAGRQSSGSALDSV